MYWRPLPSRAPRPEREQRLAAGPARRRTAASTSPVRASTTRAPASRAGRGGRLPVLAQLGQETRSRRGGFVDDAVAGVAVVADRAGVDQRAARPPRRPRADSTSVGVDAAVAQALLERARPALAADVDAAQVDHGVDAAAARSASNSPVSGFQCSSSAFDGARRTIRSTRWSVARSAVTSAEPIRPDEPAIAMTAVGHGSSPSYRPRSASNAPSSSRCLMVVRKRPASAPSISRWS